MILLPAPSSIFQKDGSYTGSLTIEISTTCPDNFIDIASNLADEIEKITFSRPTVRRTNITKNSDNAITLNISKENKLEPESYKLDITEKGAFLDAGDPAGLFYAIQTLTQIIRQYCSALPCVTITDSPDIPNRGFYYDCTRGKVPKLETLFALVEKMAHYKLNQLQLYIEHTFAFEKHPELWAGSDPLSHEDILKLDQHCKKYYIELIPSLSTFGHCYHLIRAKRNEHLNELPGNASESPYSWKDRMAHYTLNCSDPKSIELMKELLQEYSPLFSSTKINIGGDETFDLGKGKNLELAKKNGTGRLYVDFISKVIKEVEKMGKQAMMWGDILITHPDLISELPENTIVLNWDYSINPTRMDSKTFTDSGLEFYNCPGTLGWNYWMNSIDDASQNILNAVKLAKKHNASGILNTDWGDCGHINLLANSYHGLILGAAASWNISATESIDFDKEFSIIELGDSTGLTGKCLRDVNSDWEAGWWDIVSCLDTSEDIPKNKRLPQTGALNNILKLNSERLLSRYGKIKRCINKLQKLAGTAKAQDPLAYQEFIIGCKGQALTEAIVYLLQKAEGIKVPESNIDFRKIADDIRRFEIELTKIWHKRNRPSEYYRLRMALMTIAEKLDALS